MHCAKATRQLQLYIDRQLTLTQMRTLEAHLSSCSTCREELFYLEEISQALRVIEPVVEPADLTMHVMRRIAFSTQHSTHTGPEPSFTPLRPSLREVLSAILLATVAMLGIALEQPTLLASMHLTSSHDALSQFCLAFWNTLISINSGALMLGLWVIGTLIGVWITLALAGTEMRNQWFRAVIDRLPVW